MSPYTAILAPPTIRSPAQNHVQITVSVHSSPCLSSLKKTSFHVDALFPLCGPSRIEDLTLRAPPGRIMRDGVHRRVDPYVDSLAACSNRESPRAISCTNTLRRRYSWPSKRVSRSHSMLFRERAADREGSNLPGVIAPPA